ncbi:hypothetical protein RAH32_02605 [Paracoccus sp. WLY502]|uniref:hypothetical protein n=1 Tax=Paracoccus yibinensis TaxID=3068891 RepID=UPI0027966093|nr:hypothetical protein [Paracoccus sp. WLY502]MDQ1899336.1 hypothetical protein [Paracoccus sp. WLY502]
MAIDALRVMLVQADAVLAERLATEIRSYGHVVVGPFADMHEAIEVAATVQAAILDMAVQPETGLWLADSLQRSDVPFVFLTERGNAALPQRFKGRHTYPRHRHAAPLLADLHGQRQNLRPADDDSLGAIATQMMQRSRRIMPDDPSAERLVEATLQRAVAQRTAGRAPDDVGDWLLRLLDQEYRLRGRTHLH